MAQVFHPFKIRHRNTACISIHIGNDHHAFVTQDHIAPCRHRAIGGLNDQTGLHTAGVVTVDHTFECGRDQNIAGRFQYRRPIWRIGGAREVFNTTGFRNPCFQRFNIQAHRIANGTITLDDSRNPCAIFFAEELCSVISHISQALNDDRLAIQCARQTSPSDIFWMAEEFLQRILYPAPSRLGPTFDAAAVHRLASHTGARIDVSGVHPLVLIGNPSHFSFARAHIRGRHVL